MCLRSFVIQSCYQGDTVEGRVGKRELHPQAPHRTVLDSLPSYGSCYLIVLNFAILQRLVFRNVNILRIILITVVLFWTFTKITSTLRSFPLSQNVITTTMLSDYLLAYVIFASRSLISYLYSECSFYLLPISLPNRFSQVPFQSP